ncbi:MAG: extracellular solute-binding protein [Burkholderiaceae bacterium]|jgi:multiple sugar transport system substrate-binding protein
MSSGSGFLRGVRTTPTRRSVLAAGLAAAVAPAVFAKPSRTLTIAAFPLVDQIVKDAAPAWALRHPDVALNVVMRQYDDHHTAMTTALSTGVYLPDVMALESSYVGKFSNGGGLSDLLQARYDIGRYRSRYVAYAFDQAVNRKGQVVAAPTDIGPGTLLYREDLLDRAGVAEADMLLSWDAYVDAGVKLKKATGANLIGNVKTLKDLMIRSGLSKGQGIYFDSDSNVLVDTPRFHRAFELALRVRRSQLEGRLATWSNEWAEAFRRGATATELGGSWMVGQLANWVAPTTKGLWRAAQLPESTFVSYGGTYYAIPRDSDPENKALAWELVEMLTLDPARQLAALKTQDAFPALLAAQDDPFLQEPLPFLGGERARLLWREAAQHITATAVHRQSNFAEDAVNTELDYVLDDGKDIKQALSDVARLLERRAHR